MAKSTCLARLAALLLPLLLTTPALAGDLKIAVIKFGTVSWEMDVIQHHGLAKAKGVALEVLPLANKNATTVALQAGDTDMIVTDWIWVSRQRTEGADYSFVPFSHASGALMVPPESPIKDIADLKGRKLGIAGGPLDKSWLLLRGHGLERLGFDLDGSVEKVFAAAPLLNEQILAGRLDGVINFWHFAARLEAKGYRRLLEVSDIAGSFGLESKVPLIGYVFRDALAQSDKDSLLGFLGATQEAKKILRASDEEWQRLRPLMRAKDDATFLALRDRYRQGIPDAWGSAQQKDAETLFAILAKYGGEKLVGASRELAPGTFWPHFSY